MQRITGFADLFSPDSDVYTFMENTARQLFGRYGYEELRTPLVEFTELFCRSIGTETDVVQKEMYTFADRKERSLTLRPEATAGVMRAYMASGRHGVESLSKFFTTGAMFRYERPQKGRMRQFHQINCECLGVDSPLLDAEIIVMLMAFLEAIGITNTELHLNSLGCAQCRPQYRKVLYAYLKELDPTALCADCLRRMESNPLRVLDCKVPTCRQHTEKAPRMGDHICADCATHFATVRQTLEKAGVPCVLDHRLVRGLDYYCRTTFEVVSGDVGAQSSIAGGGRYDGLVKQLGGPDVPGIGFACGMERLAMLVPALPVVRPHFHVVSMGEAAQQSALALALTLRRAGYGGDLCHGGGFKGQMRQAGKSGARFALILGEDELRDATVMVKDMDASSQECVPVADLVAYFIQKFA